jgi:hydrogenase nickel incorporation protein HypA/HybF
MHELSIALQLVDLACERAAALGDVRVDAVFIRVGPFSGVVKDALMFCFDSAARGSAIEGARLEIEEVPVVAFCPRCGSARQLAGPQRRHCPVCDEPTPDIVAGNELELTALEVTDHAPHR